MCVAFAGLAVDCCVMDLGWELRCGLADGWYADGHAWGTLREAHHASSFCSLFSHKP